MSDTESKSANTKPTGCQFSKFGHEFRPLTNDRGYTKNVQNGLQYIVRYKILYCQACGMTMEVVSENATGMSLGQLFALHVGGQQEGKGEQQKGIATIPTPMPPERTM